MLLRDAQEQVRILRAALLNSAGMRGEPFLPQIEEVADAFKKLTQRQPSEWKELIVNREKTIGVMLLATLAVANELEVDSLEALESILQSESP